MVWSLLQYFSNFSNNLKTFFKWSSKKLSHLENKNKYKQTNLIKFQTCNLKKVKLLFKNYSVNHLNINYLHASPSTYFTTLKIIFCASRSVGFRSKFLSINLLAERTYVPHSMQPKIILPISAKNNQASVQQPFNSHRSSDGNVALDEWTLLLFKNSRKRAKEGRGGGATIE